MHLQMARHYFKKTLITFLFTQITFSISLNYKQLTSYITLRAYLLFDTYYKSAKIINPIIKILMSRSRSRDTSPCRQDEFKGKKLFVSRLPQSVTNDELRDIFSEFGSITDVYVKNKETFSFGFVEFSSVKQAEKAIKGMNMHSFKGKQIKVEFSKPRPPRNGQGGGAGGNRTFNRDDRGGNDRDRSRSRDNDFRGSSRNFGGGNQDRPKGCFNCGQNGHFSRECTEPKKQRNNGGGYGSGERKDNGGRNNGGGYGNGNRGDRQGGYKSGRNDSPRNSRDSPIRTNKQSGGGSMDY